MKRLYLALCLIPLLTMASAHGQSVASVKLSAAADTITNPATETDNDRALAARAIVALKRLYEDVPVYRSLGAFEENGKVAVVSLETFRNDLQDVAAEVEFSLSRLPESKLKSEITNALESYRDGAFWWRKIDQPRVDNVSMLASMNFTHTSADEALLSTVPYTVVIHWRQASKYLRRAEDMMNSPRK